MLKATDEQVTEKAKSLYNLYGDSAGWKNYQDNAMPTWQELPINIQSHWEAVARGVLNEPRLVMPESDPYYLSEYLKENVAKGVYDHNVRASVDEAGKLVYFYIHPANVDGDTLDFWVSGNHLVTNPEEVAIS